ncbi:unnamed protein product [Rotaria sp. Silwood2]|nr:unnamed protein product [Rotaria sp. Silwood2]CAF4083632.1 unnamed protein product [Rotaria sp. Silwood2]
MNYFYNLPPKDSQGYRDALLVQRFSQIISMSTDEGSEDTEIFQVEVGFYDENECRSALEPLATENQCSFEQQFGLQMVALTVPQSFADNNHQQHASKLPQSITSNDGSLRLGIDNSEIKILLGAIEQEVADIIAICSESGTLRNIVLTAAGTPISQESQQPWFEGLPGSLKSFGVENPAFASPMIALIKQSLERHRKPLSVLFVISPIAIELIIFLLRFVSIPLSIYTD